MTQTRQEVAEPYGRDQEHAARKHSLRVAEEALIPLSRERRKTNYERRDQDAESPYRYMPGRILR